MTAPQFGVSGDRQVALGASSSVPIGTVGYDACEHRLALPVGLLQRLVADGQRVLGRGAVMVAALFGGTGIGGGAQSGQAGVAEGGGEQGHAAAVFHGLELADVSGQDDLGTAGLPVGDQVSRMAKRLIKIRNKKGIKRS